MRSDAKRDKILDRIKKLLALSMSSNVNEAANAAAASQRLMLEHRLTEVDVSDAQEGQMFELSIAWVCSSVDSVAIGRGSHVECATWEASGGSGSVLPIVRLSWAKRMVDWIRGMRRVA